MFLTPIIYNFGGKKKKRRMTTNEKHPAVRPADGKLGIMVVGCGAVSTTFMTGVFMARKGLAKPIGSMTQYDKIRIGKGENKKYLHYKDIVSMPTLDDLVFAAWDVFPENAYPLIRSASVSLSSVAMCRHFICISTG